MPKVFLSPVKQVYPKSIRVFSNFPKNRYIYLLFLEKMYCRCKRNINRVFTWRSQNNAILCQFYLRDIKEIFRSKDHSRMSSRRKSLHHHTIIIIIINTVIIIIRLSRSSFDRSRERIENSPKRYRRVASRVRMFPALEKFLRSSID